jgi:glycogen synthase
MSAVRTITVVFASCLLAGCMFPYHGTTQTGCEESTQRFAEMEACLKQAVANAYTAREQSSNDVKLYFIKADDVANRVRKDVISEFNGRIELRQLYVDLRLKTEVR